MLLQYSHLHKVTKAYMLLIHLRINCIYEKILFVLSSFKPNFDLLRESGECFRGVANLPIGNESTEDVYILQGTGIPSQF